MALQGKALHTAPVPEGQRACLRKFEISQGTRGDIFLTRGTGTRPSSGGWALAPQPDREAGSPGRKGKAQGIEEPQGKSPEVRVWKEISSCPASGPRLQVLVIYGQRMMAPSWATARIWETENKLIHQAGLQSSDSRSRCPLNTHQRSPLL